MFCDREQSPEAASVGGLFHLILMRFPRRLLARSCRSGMSAAGSLSGVNRTWRGEPNSVAVDPNRTSHLLERGASYRRPEGLG